MDARNITCMNSSREIYGTVFVIRVTTSCISGSVNVIALLIMFLGGGLKGNSNKKLLFRLVVYLLAANLLFVMVQILGVMSVTYKSGHVHGVFWHKSCSILGFFDQLTAWTRNL